MTYLSELKVMNKELPAHLQGANSPGYIHDVFAYKGKNFTMELKNGKRVHCREWADDVEQFYLALDNAARLDHMDGGTRLARLEEKYFGGKEMTSMQEQMQEQMLEDFTKRMVLDNRPMVAWHPTPPIGSCCRLKTPSKVPLAPLNTSFYDGGYVCVVTWNDGTKTKVTWDGCDAFSEEMAVAMALIKKTVGLAAYNAVVDSIDKFERDKEAAEQAKIEAAQKAAYEQARLYRKNIKKAAKRARKRAEFEAAVQNELNNEFI